jgi:hypothetical protein
MQKAWAGAIMPDFSAPKALPWAISLRTRLVPSCAGKRFLVEAQERYRLGALGSRKTSRAAGNQRDTMDG